MITPETVTDIVHTSHHGCPRNHSGQADTTPQFVIQIITFILNIFFTDPESILVYGGLSAKGLKSVSVAGTVFGSAGLKNVERADLQNVRGSLTARVVGRLHGSRIGGNVTAREVEGSLNIDQVGGNATLTNIGAEVRMR